MARVIVAIACLLLGLVPSTAVAAFGFEDIDVTFTGPDGSPQTQAGSHPYALTTTVQVNTVEDSGVEAPDGNLENLLIDYPPGLAALPTAVPTCSTADFLQIEGSENACPDSSAIGIGEVTVSTSGPIPAGSEDFLDPLPVYNLPPLPGAIGRIGFVAAGVPVVAELGINDVQPHNGFLALSELSQAALFYSARISIWGNPPDPSHDPDRGQCAFTTGSCPVAIPQAAFLTLPRSCTGPLEAIFYASSLQDPEQWIEATVFTHDNSKPPNPIGLTGCSMLAFAPQIDVQPTTDLAETPTGLELSIEIHDEGLANPSGVAQSEMRELELVLPEGMTVNPDWGDIVTCTAAQYAQEAINSEPEEGCPQGSEIGTIELETPLLADEVLNGQIFLAQPDDPNTDEPGAENPFDSLLALYVVIKDPGLGILITQEGEVEVDPATEQPIAWFGQVPQLPFSRLDLHLHAGDRSLLVTPPECGEFTSEAALSPWSKPDNWFLVAASFEIASGFGGEPCPTAEDPPEGPDADDPPPSNNPPPATTALPDVGMSPAIKRRSCAKGKKRRIVRGDVRCVRKRCARRRGRVDRRDRGGGRRKPSRRCGRSRGRGRTPAPHHTSS